MFIKKIVNVRHKQILQLLSKNKTLTVKKLIEMLQVSPATIRRDITELNNQGLARKIKNGLAFVEPQMMDNLFSDLDSRLKINTDEKHRITSEALKYCNPNHSILLTSGSTIFMLGQKICQAQKNIQVVTNYMPLLFHLIKNMHENIIVLGGQYNRHQSITLSDENINNYAAHIMFTSARGLSAKGIYKNDVIINISEKEMLNKINKLVVLIDSDKIGVEHGTIFCTLDKIDVLITDKKADPAIIKLLVAKNIEVVLV